MAQYPTSRSLPEVLSDALPQDVHLQIRHISTPPTPCPALFSAPPAQNEETTYCESHFLTASIDDSSSEVSESREIIAFAVEVLIYSTEKLTTLFVSKADSSGHLHLLKRADGSSSIIRTVISTFLRYLIQVQQRPNARLVLSLFARSQDQYLFPGSIENPTKHVLDDRQLVKWWCRVLDPILRDYAVEKPKIAPVTPTTTATGYLIVPGCDKYETRLFFPPTAKLDPPHSIRWHNSHPLYQIAPIPGAPPRCLVPHFPDDPKARFLDALDDEIIDVAPKESPTKRGSNGKWKTVRSLEQFWEMMSYRQECAAGRVVGFLWVVFTPPGLEEANDVKKPDFGLVPKLDLPTPNQSQSQGAAELDLTTLPHIAPPDLEPISPIPSSPIPAPAEQPDRPAKSVPDPSAPPDDQTAPATTEIPESTPHYHWPPSTRAPIILSDPSYDILNDLLLELDFAGVELAAESTTKWIGKVQELAKLDGKWEGEAVTGKRTTGRAPANGVVGVVNVVGAGLVRKKRKNADGDGGVDGELEGETKNGGGGGGGGGGQKAANGVNVLGAGLVRKKVKA
jgi:regulator of Ty1 transposition protein 109